MSLVIFILILLIVTLFSFSCSPSSFVVNRSLAMIHDIMSWTGKYNAWAWVCVIHGLVTLPELGAVNTYITVKHQSLLLRLTTLSRTFHLLTFCFLWTTRSLLLVLIMGVRESQSDLPANPHYNLPRIAYLCLQKPCNWRIPLSYSLLPNSPPRDHHLQVAMVLLLLKEDIIKYVFLLTSYTSEYIVKVFNFWKLNAEPCHFVSI